MILSGIGLAIDVWGIQDVLVRFQGFRETGIYPEPDLGNVMLGELARWAILFIISLGIGIWGYLGWKKSRYT